MATVHDDDESDDDTATLGPDGFDATHSALTRETRLPRSSLLRLRTQSTRQCIFPGFEELAQSQAATREYAERLAREAGVSVQSVRSTIRAAVESHYGCREDPQATSPEGAERQIESIRQVHNYVESGEGTLADLEITDEIRRVA